jgi:hypothetical protein
MSRLQSRESTEFFANSRVTRPFWVPKVSREVERVSRQMVWALLAPMECLNVFQPRRLEPRA